jgi:hypothetical protein
VAFREVGVHEIKEVLRLWLRGEGLRSIARLARVDRKTARRYVEAAAGCGLDRAGGESQLGDELLSAVAERVLPHRSGGRGDTSAPWPAGTCAGNRAASPARPLVRFLSRTSGPAPCPSTCWKRPPRHSTLPALSRARSL